MGTSPKPTEVFDTYWRFAYERQEVFYRRVTGSSQPWTADAVLLSFRFTNVYRSADRVSQYLIRQVIYEGNSSPEEVFFRIMIFKTFNRIETWESLKSRLGDIRYSDYSFSRYSGALDAIRGQGNAIYSNAYVMPPGTTAFGYPEKHKNHLKLVEFLMRDRVPARLACCQTMAEAFRLLAEYPTIGPFLAYQYVIDINYSEITNFSEMEYVVPGPGARSGIQKCFSELGGLSESDVIRYVADRQEEQFAARGLRFRTLWGRPLQLINCQNIFCEVDKYSRTAHPSVQGRGNRTRIKQRFRPNLTPIECWFPPKWGLNDRVSLGGSYVSSL